MTNEEKAIEYSKQVANGHYYRDLCVGFQNGAEWKEQQMIDKAYEWLQNHTMKELCVKEEDSGLVQEFIKSFEDYMKGE